jgi:hypothetical protein
MADNFVTNAGSGGSTFASDEISSTHYPRVKVSWGADGVANETAVASPVPVQSSIESSQMSGAGVILTPKFAVISATTDNGDVSLVAAVSSKKIRVLSYTLVADAAITIRFESGAAGTALSGTMPLIANTGIASGFCPVGHFETAVITALSLEMTGTGNVYGHLTYVEVA